MVTISTLQEKDMINAPFMIVSVLNGISNNGAPYLSLTLQDKTGTIEAKVWDVKEQQESIAKIGSILEFEADVLKYKGKLQLRVKTMTHKNQSEYQLGDFIMASSISKDELQSGINGYINQITNSSLRQIVDELFKRKGNDFYIYPAAARNHHDYVGGLATHTLEMCQLGEAIADLYPQTNKELLLAGILIHDLGKIDEYKSPIVVEYSTQGKLLGHISMLSAELYEIAKQFDIHENEEVLLLRHMVLSHHGKLEFGSPVVPQILEAELLNLIDDMDARIQMFTKHTDQIQPGEFTPRIFPLESRTIYLPKKKDSK